MVSIELCGNMVMLHTIDEITIIKFSASIIVAAAPDSFSPATLLPTTGEARFDCCTVQISNVGCTRIN